MQPSNPEEYTGSTMPKAAAKTTEKYVTQKTFEKVMESVAKTLSKMDEKIEKNFDRVFDQFKSINLKHDGKIENMLVHIEKLEAKVK